MLYIFFFLELFGGDCTAEKNYSIQSLCHFFIHTHAATVLSLALISLSFPEEPKEPKINLYHNPEKQIKNSSFMMDNNTEKKVDDDYSELSKRLDLASKQKILEVLNEAILLDVRGPGEIEDKVLQFPFVHIPVTPKDTEKLTRFAPNLLPNKKSTSKFHTYTAIY